MFNEYQIITIAVIALVVGFAISWLIIRSRLVTIRERLQEREQTLISFQNQFKEELGEKEQNLVKCDGSNLFLTA